MRVRFRLWWEFLPFTAKAALIVVITGLSVTVSARAATPLLGGSPRIATAAPQHRVAPPVAHPTAPAVPVALTSFRPPALRIEREARHAPRMHARRAESRHHARRATARPSMSAELENEAQSRADLTVGTLRNAAPFHAVPPAVVRP